MRKLSPERLKCKHPISFSKAFTKHSKSISEKSQSFHILIIYCIEGTTYAVEDQVINA